MDMATSFSNSKHGEATPPRGICKVNDAVWKFHNPRTPHGVPKLEIIFFHGLQLGDYQNAFWKTWLARSDENVVWPRDWLGKAFCTARILAISYDSSAGQNPGQLDLYCLVENLVTNVIMDRLNIGQTCPIIIVGHCLGGMVIKQFILCAERMMAEKCQGDVWKSRKIGNFLKNIKGIFYYAPPHGGFNKEIRWNSTSRPSSELLQLLLQNGKERARINEDFRKWRENHNIRAYAIVENLPSEYLGTSGIVVDEVSGRWDADSYYTVKANHFDICKPEDMETSGIFRKLQDFIERILEEARQQGFENFQPIPKAVIGIDESIKQILQKLSENHRVGIFGMGGVGKTTLGKAIFNKLNSEFEYSCFVPDIKSITRTAEDVKEAVQNRMHHNGKVERVWVELRGKKLLLVLDDVDKDDHLEVVNNIVDNITPEICCLVTSRDKELLTSNEVDCYDMPFLKEEHAKQLFISYACSSPGEPTIDNIVRKYADKIVRKCDGLPLALEVIGKFLKSKKEKKDEIIWEQTLEALYDADATGNLDNKLWKKLRVSYDNLGEPERQMFLDAATFFNDDFTLRDAKAAWSVIYGKVELLWRTLVDLALVYHQEDEDKPITVHEQLKSMGRRIARDSKRRWWKLKGGLEFLKSKYEPDHQQICSLRLGMPEGNLAIPRSCLGRLENVQFLDVDLGLEHLTIDGAEENGILPTDNLIVLRCPAFHLFNFAACPRLAVLKLCTQVLYGHKSSRNLPESFGRLSALKILSFHSFNGGILPATFGDLAQLQRLEFISCKLLRELPGTFGRLSALQYLEFSWCYKLETLPDSFGDLCALSHLSFCGCDSLSSFPESFKQLAALKRLVVRKCPKLCTIPEFFGELSTVERMDFDHCDSLKTLPSPRSFARLAKLQHLRIFSCVSLDSLPFSHKYFPKALRVLEIGHLALKTIPANVKGRPSLQIVILGMVHSGGGGGGGGAFCTTFNEDDMLDGPSNRPAGISGDDDCPWISSIYDDF